MRRSRSGVFVAVNFYDLLSMPEVASIFEFGVVAISFFSFFAFCSRPKAATLVELSPPAKRDSRATRGSVVRDP